MDAKTGKQKVRIVSSNEDLNVKLLKLVQREHDCFGLEFDEKHGECLTCSILAEIDDRREPLRIFCKEIVDEKVKKKEGEKEMNTEPEVLKTQLPQNEETETEVLESEKEYPKKIEKEFEEIAADVEKTKKTETKTKTAPALKIDQDLEDFVKAELVSGKKPREIKAEIMKRRGKGIDAKAEKDASRICLYVSKKYELKSK